MKTSIVAYFLRGFSPRNMCFVAICLFFWPITLTYLVCVYIPLLLLWNLKCYTILLCDDLLARPEIAVAMEIFYRKSEYVRSFVIHISALQFTAYRMWQMLKKTRFSKVLAWCLQIVLEILTAWNDNEKGEKHLTSRTIGGRAKRNVSLTNLSELLEYEELEDVYHQDLSRRVMRKVMHHSIPSNPFKATVLVHSAGPTSAYEKEDHDLLMSKRREQAIVSIFDKYSPASFPSTPFSRANIMSRTEEKTNTLMFVARDILRLEAQSASVDEYSRKVAKHAKSSGQHAVFDPTQSSSGIVLSCGNHCALKVGKGLCSSTRTMVSIPQNRYVYLEFSITAANETIPSIAIGLSPPDCPLNVTVGSWAQSVGLFNDKHLLISSRWFEAPITTATITAGSTLGMLVYYPGPTVLPSAVAVNNEGVFTKLLQYVVSDAVPVVDSEQDQEQGEEGDISDAATRNQLTSIESSYPSSLIVKFNINGVLLDFLSPTMTAISDITRLNAPLYPTVSIISEGTKVWCRLCEADIIYRNHDLIGAPSGAKVYALDGSLLIDDESH